jgi:hypothetical protein
VVTPTSPAFFVLRFGGGYLGSSTQGVQSMGKERQFWTAVYSQFNQMEALDQGRVEVPRSALIQAFRCLENKKPYTPEARAAMVVIDNCLGGRKPYDDEEIRNAAPGIADAASGN